MKKFILLILLIIFAYICKYTFKPVQVYNVLKVDSADSFYIDFNKNLKPDEDEKIKLSAVTSLKPNFNTSTKEQTEYIGIDEQSGFLVGYFADEYALEHLLYKNVEVEFVKETLDEKYKFAKVYLNGEDWGKTLLKKGYATVYKDSINAQYYLKFENTYKIKQNAKNLLVNNYVILNLKSNVYHHLTCKYGQMVKNFRLEKYKEIAPYYKNCNYCSLKNKKDEKKQEEKFFKNFDITVGNISIFFTDFSKNLKPTMELKDENGKILFQLINSTKNSIDFAVYGMDYPSTIIDALKNAQKRGVKIRWVADKNSDGKTTYKTFLIDDILKNVVYDNQPYQNEKKSPKTLQNALMHNKFFIFDDETIYTGSLNVAPNDLSGYNSNSSIVIKSKEIAQIFKKEFEQMYSGKFHTTKEKNLNNRKIKVDNSYIEVLFSPQDNIIYEKIIPLINSAQNYIYVPIFTFTHKDLMTALENAHKRGVDVKLITDAANSHGDFHPHPRFRKLNMNIKTEHYAGKMHMKSMIIDDKYTIIGSMNFTKSGNNINDENVLIIENFELAHNFKNQFLYMYNNIPNKWIKTSPRAESHDSIGACYDNVDNDFDGLIDKNDTSCLIQN